jgi:hypothetical protein
MSWNDNRGNNSVNSTTRYLGTDKYLSLPVFLSTLKSFRVNNTVARMCGDYYKTGYWIVSWIYWITVTVYTLHSSLLQLQLFSEDCCSARTVTRNWNGPRNSLITNSLWVSLKTPAPTRQPLLQPTLMASLAITHSLTAAAPLSNTNSLTNCLSCL